MSTTTEQARPLRRERLLRHPPWVHLRRPSNLLWILSGVVTLASVLGCGESEQERMGKQTLENWTAMRDIFQANYCSDGEDFSIAVTKLRRIASEIDALPTVGVDPEAVALAVEMASTSRDLADVAELIDDPSTWITGILHVFLLDAFGVNSERLAQSKAAVEKAENVDEKVRRMRPLLSQR